MGKIMVMPGLSKHPAYENMKIDADGTIYGLFLKKLDEWKVNLIYLVFWFFLIIFNWNIYLIII